MDIVLSVQLPGLCCVVQGCVVQLLCRTPEVPCASGLHVCRDFRPVAWGLGYESLKLAERRPPPFTLRALLPHPFQGTTLQVTQTTLLIFYICFPLSVSSSFSLTVFWTDSHVICHWAGFFLQVAQGPVRGCGLAPQILIKAKLAICCISLVLSWEKE